MSDKPMILSAEQILLALENSHGDDVFIRECKNGPTTTGSHARMDAWVMNKSWSRLCFTGYEVKVSRRDFLADNKWHAYLPLCNQLYFVTPKHLVKPEEVPDGVGLKYVSGGRVFTAKKATHRDVRPPMELFCYILMCRAKIGVETDPHDLRMARIARAKQWVSERGEAKRVGEVIRYETSKKIIAVESENKFLKDENDQLKRIKEIAKKLGIRNWESDEDIGGKILRSQNGIPNGLAESIRRMHKECETALRAISELPPGGAGIRLGVEAAGTEGSSSGR